MDIPQDEWVALGLDVTPEELLGRMKGEDGFKLKDRKFRLRTYPKSWTGTSAVKWLKKNKYAISTDHALDIGRIFEAYGYFHEIRHNHAFVDKKYLYQWTERGDSEEGRLKKEVALLRDRLRELANSGKQATIAVGI